MTPRRLCCVVAAVCCTVVVGCYRKSADGDGLVFSFQPWVPLLVILAGVAAVAMGIRIFSNKDRVRGVLLTVGGPVIVAVVAPGMYLDRVVVNDDGFYSRHGFWWSPTIHQIRYDDLQRVTVGFEERTGRRGRKSISYFFDCTLKSGQQERVPIGDIMEEALPEIVAHFKDHHIPVEVPPNLPG